MSDYDIYLRKSRADLEAEARGESETLKRHEKILLDLAHKMNINIKKNNIFREVVSGETIASRPVMQEVLSRVEKGLCKGVLVVEVERLARGDTIDQGIVAQAFKYSHTKIITPTKVYDPDNEFDEEYFEFGLFMSRREYKTINRRLQQGRILSVREGKYLGNVAPFGYSRIKLQGQKGFTLEVLPEESRIVELIYNWYTGIDRIGVSLIANKLNDMKVPTRKGGDWTTSTIRGILSNPVYIGKIRWNSRPTVKNVIDGEIVKTRPRAKEEDLILVEGLHEAFINYDIYDMAQQYIAENPTLPIPSRYKVMNPLAGIIICEVCGRKMKRRPYTSSQEPTLVCDGPTCNNISSKLNLVEEILINQLTIWLNDYKLSYGANLKPDVNIELEVLEKSIEILNKELETLNKQLNNMHDLLEQGVYNKDTFIDRSNTVNNKIGLINKDRTALMDKINSMANTKKNKEIIIPKLEKIIELYNALDDPGEKNRLLKEVLDKATYKKTVNGRWHNREDDFELVIFPRF